MRFDEVEGHFISYGSPNKELLVLVYQDCPGKEAAKWE